MPGASYRNTFRRSGFGENDPRNALFTKLTGSSWRGWIDDRGRFEALTLVPPKDLPRLLLPMAEQIHAPPGRSLPCLKPHSALAMTGSPPLRIRRIARRKWAKTLMAACNVRLFRSPPRATIAIKLKRHSAHKKSGKGQMVINYTGVLESFRVKNRLLLKPRSLVTQSHRNPSGLQLNSQPGATP